MPLVCFIPLPWGFSLRLIVGWARDTWGLDVRFFVGRDLIVEWLVDLGEMFERENDWDRIYQEWEEREREREARDMEEMEANWARVYQQWEEDYGGDNEN